MAYRANKTVQQSTNKNSIPKTNNSSSQPRQEEDEEEDIQNVLNQVKLTAGKLGNHLG